MVNRQLRHADKQSVEARPNCGLIIILQQVAPTAVEFYAYEQCL